LNGFGGIWDMGFYEFIDRAKNFQGDFNCFQKHVSDNLSFFTRLNELNESIHYEWDDAKELSRRELLQNVFTRTYEFIVTIDNAFEIFDKDYKYFQSVFDACLFTSLCHFINTTKRIKGLSLRKFVYKHSSFKYSIKGSPNYFDLKNSHKNTTAFALFEDEERNLRQTRYRLFSKKKTYVERSEGSAIPMDSEYELSFMSIIIQDLKDTSLVDVYKRIFNLYNEIHNIHKLPKDDNYGEKVKSALKKFMSKVKKINYEDFLRLQKSILSKIDEDKQYYGINIYRFEKNLRLYNITNEVNSLLRCRNKAEEDAIFKKSIILNSIYFPHLYRDFSLIDNYVSMSFCIQLFYNFMNIIVSSSCLIIDALIQEGYFGDCWYDFFCQTINEMTTSVFYDPKEIDYSITPESQEKFIRIITNPVLFKF
jgi:hypothetical protein